MTPEEAYEMTEKKWKAIAAGNLEIRPGDMDNCAFCQFARKVAHAGAGPICCYSECCPVPPVFGYICWNLYWLQECIDAYDEESPDEIYSELAQSVLAKLISNKAELIAEMERISGEK